MHFITAIGERWKRVVGAGVTIALLSAVAAVGVTLFGSELLAAWKASSNAEQSLTVGGAFEGLLNFDAPAGTVARFAVQNEEAQASLQKANNGTLAKSWIFTQENLAEIMNQVEGLQKTNPLTFYPAGMQLQAVVGLIQRLFPNTALANFAQTFANAWLTTANGFLIYFYHLPPIPIASPSA